MKRKSLSAYFTNLSFPSHYQDKQTYFSLISMNGSRHYNYSVLRGLSEMLEGLYWYQLEPASEGMLQDQL